MNFKKTTLIFILFITYSYSQNKNSSVSQKLFKIIENKQSDDFYEHLPPKLKELAPKNQLLNFMSELHNNSNFETMMKNFKRTKFQKSYTFKGKNYQLINYYAETHIKFKENATNTFIQKGKNHFSKLYGKRFKYYSKEKLIVTSKEFKTILINKEEDWWHIPGIDKIKPYLKHIIDEKVIKELFVN